MCVYTIGAKQTLKLNQKSDRLKLLQELWPIQTSGQVQCETTHGSRQLTDKKFRDEKSIVALS